MNGDFVEQLEELIAAAEVCLESALMSDDFLKAVDQSLGEIPNIDRQQEPNVDKTNTA